jgi:Xaa-Pro aminopeptidase
MITSLPVSDFADRIARLQGSMLKEKLDIIITFGDEAEPQYVRYFSDYWPSFETAGVFVPRSGDACLLIGPESGAFSSSRSKLPDIRRLKEFRESSEPEYPGEVLTTFPDLFREAIDGGSFRRIGIVGYPLMPAPIYASILDAAKQFSCQVVRAERLIIEMKQIKSEREVELMRNAARISEEAFARLLQIIKPGMTGIQMTGEAHKLIRDLGAESEAYPMWCACGPDTVQAISRPTHKKIVKNELVQVQVGARLGGYASSFGRPLVFGRASPQLRRFIETGLGAHRLVIDSLKAGVPADRIDAVYREFLRARDAEQLILYGPCHGTGLMEGEHPWIEKGADFLLEENMTFCVDNFMKTDEYGQRWEDVVRVTKDGVEEFTNKFQELLVL